MVSLRVDVWSDIACPWCYVGKRRLEAAIERVTDRGTVEVVWRAFELDPKAPRTLDPNLTYAQRIAMKYGTPVTRAEEMIEQMTRTAARDGLEFRFDRIRPGNTFDAHRLVHHALEHGKQDAMKERLLRAYLTEGEPIGEPAVLARLASEVGLDLFEVRAVLASDAHAEAVRADEHIAQDLEIHGVPFFVIGGRLGVSGAQPVDILVSALRQGYDEIAAKTSERATTEGDEFPDGAVCGPDGC